jgi:hypothetical protein
MLLFPKQRIAFPPQPFTLIAILNGSEVLLRGKHKTARQDQTAEQQ